MLGDITTYEYEPASDVESEDIPIGQQYGKESLVSTEEVEREPTPEPVQESVQESVQEPVQESVPEQQETQSNASNPDSTASSNGVKPNSKQGRVQGFQLVQATGLTDTSTPAPKGSDIPHFATATPIPETPLPSQVSKPVQQTPTPAPEQRQLNPLQDNSKSKQFTLRTDYMIAEFFSRQVQRLTRGAPEAIDRSYRVFQQRFKESLGKQWAHITSQPEVEEAIQHVQKMYDYFESLEKLVIKQMQAIQKVNDTESELAIWYKQQGVLEPEGSIRDNMLHLSDSYTNICNERSALILAYEQYAQFLKTFKDKAIADALMTMKKQHTSRLELDAYGSKLGALEEKKLKTFAKTPSPSEAASLEKELTAVRTKFQDAKSKYQQMSTSLIDKAGLLDLKKGVDFAAHIQKIRQVHDSFNRGRVGDIGVPEETEVDYDMKE